MTLKWNFSSDTVVEQTLEMKQYWDFSCTDFNNLEQSLEYSLLSYLHDSFFIAPLYDPHHFLPFKSVGDLADDFSVTWLYSVLIREVWEDCKEGSKATDKTDNKI